VKGGDLLLHRTLDLSVSLEDAVAAAAPQHLPDTQPSGAYDRFEDRFEAEAAMQTSVIEKAEVRELTAGAAAEAMAVEVTQAVSVAAAYFEDTLQIAPESLLVAGTISAGAVSAMMEANGLEGLRAQEMVDAAMLETAAVSASVPRGWLAGVRGALKS
jgi:type IV pilus assembly protein PilM